MLVDEVNTSDAKIIFQNFIFTKFSWLAEVWKDGKEIFYTGSIPAREGSYLRTGKMGHTRENGTHSVMYHYLFTEYL